MAHPANCKYCGKRSPEPDLTNRRRCNLCGKEMARQCIYEHKKYHCKKNSKKTKRSFKKKKCSICWKSLHEKSMSRHMKTHSKKNKSSNVQSLQSGQRIWVCFSCQETDRKPRMYCQETKRKPGIYFCTSQYDTYFSDYFCARPSKTLFFPDLGAQPDPIYLGGFG